MKSFFAKRTIKMADPTISETLKMAAIPGIIPLAGGIPNPDLFPIDFIKSVTDKLLKEKSSQILQYSPTHGLPNLREQIALIYSEKWHKKITPEQVLIVTGSQQGLDLIGKTFMEKSDRVLVENPTYLAAILAFQGYEVKFQTVPLLDNGIDLLAFKKILNNNSDIKLAYFIPTFQNPTGITWDLSVRKSVLKIAEEKQLLIVEDDPYSELYFDQKPSPSLAQLDKSDKIIHLGTFSKTFCPGLRVGFIIADEKIISKMALIKQAMDLHTSSLSQAMVCEFIKDKSFYLKQMKTIRQFYQIKSQSMQKILKDNFTGLATWTNPTGGLFVWMKIPGIDVRELYQQAIKVGVSFMPGYPFYANKIDYSTLRVTFATVHEKQIEIALVKIRKIILNIKNTV